MNDRKTVYLAGKVTGDPDYIDKFTYATRYLESYGYIVLHPALLPSSGFSYDAYMRMTRAMLDECDSVCFLEDWQDSNGAKDEFSRATETTKEIFFFKDWMRSKIANEW